jgi:hypothetical protein
VNNLSEIEREARHTRQRIDELEGLTQKFDQALVRAETERNLHLDKIAGERAKLGELIDAAALIVQHLGADVPEVAQPEEILEPVVAVADSPFDVLAQDHAEALVDDPVPEPTFEYVAEAVAQIADEAPAIEDASDAPEMTDEQVERLEEQTVAALVEDVAQARELETAGTGPRRFNPFAGNPFS